jgi:hypothetical protein
MSGSPFLSFLRDRLSDTPYCWDIIEAPLSEVANQEKLLPANFITADGFGITEAARRYLAPLIGVSGPGTSGASRPLKGWSEAKGGSSLRKWQKPRRGHPLPTRRARSSRWAVRYAVFYPSRPAARQRQADRQL